MKIRVLRFTFIAILFLVYAAVPASAGTPFMLKDILLDSGSSMGKVLHVEGTTVYFFANNGSSTGLWKTDGTATGTVLLHADLTGGDSSFPVKGMVNGELVFESDNDLWKTDGTPAGTVLVKDFTIIGWSDDSSSVVASNILFFMADGGDGSGYELWKSNGTTAGTVLVKDIYSGASSSYPIYFAAMGGKAYFAASDSTNGKELWKSDGSDAGTVMVRDISTVGDGASPRYLTTVGSQIYFTAVYSTYGRELWVTDGTYSGTTMVEDINTSGESNPSNLTAVGSVLYFAADDGTHGKELWRSDDGTAANTFMVADIWTGATWNHGLGSTSERAMAVMGGDLYFRATDALNNNELWKTGAGGTVKVKEINSTGQSNPEYFAAVGDTLYFSADDGSSGRELWMSQGTEGTTARVADINSGSAASNPTLLTAGTQRIFFAATDGSHGNEPWVLHTETDNPNDPTSVASSSHTASTWSSTNQITVEWSGATDNGTSGVRGYSVVFDTSPSTTPDQEVDVAHTSDPHQVTSGSLADGTSHYFHLSTCDWAGNCTSTEHLGPFWIESQPPAGPSALASTSHTVGVWSTQTTLTMQWSGASDGGSGMTGYSVLFDTNSTTDPGTTTNVAHATDPHTSSSSTLSGGTYWFHLRACDSAGSCSMTQHSGPYRIDSSAPSNPSSLSSTSHTTSEFSNDPSITMAWSGASDASGSGVVGYSVLINETSNTQIDTSTEVAHIDGISVHNWTSSDLSNGNSYYFHLRTCDTAGACSATVHNGPFMIDVSPPTDPSEVTSSSHQPGTWSNDAEVDIVWSGASSLPWGAPLDGYKVKFNTSATVWDAGTEHWVDHGATPSYTETLTEGEGYYFHLKTCDAADNCTSTVHLGPFNLDFTTPSAPTSSESTSHETGVWSSDTQIDLQWSGAGDTGGSGLAGYSVECDTNAPGVPDSTVDVAQTSDPHAFTSSPLDDGSNWYCHIRSCDTAGSCADPAHLGPFSVEQTAPTDPTAASTSHEPLSWSSIDQIVMEWEGASDAGSGLDGYSFEFSNSSDTIPDTTVDQAHGTDPHTTTSAVLADGASHWFHLRTCDNSGTCSSTIHLGPYKIDTQDPTAPTVSISSHTANTWSSSTAINLSWSGATDVAGGSGVAGYSYIFDTAADTEPDTEIDRQHQSDTTYWETSDPLEDGPNHWFHLRTLDRAVNSATTQHLGPFKIDSIAPDMSSADVHSTSHTVGEESGDSTIDMAWATATDAGSGLSGYFQHFSTNAAMSCSSENTEGSETSSTSSNLDNGSWYFHICAIDEILNRSEVVTVGPFVVNASADLSVTLTDSPDPAQPGDSLTYTATLLNNGPSTATQFEFTLILPDGFTGVSIDPGYPICSFNGGPSRVICFWMEDEILSGESKQILIVGTIDEGGTAPLLAEATVTGYGPPDPNASNNTAAASTGFPEFDNADIAVSATAYPDPVSPGANLTYTVTVSNEGPTWSEGVFLFHDLPPETTFVSSVPGEPDCTTDVPWCDPSMVCFICELGTMAPSETRVITLTLGIDPAFDDDWIFASFYEETDETDPDHTNNGVEVQVAVGEGPEVPFLPCEVRPFDDTNEGYLGASISDIPREYCTRLFVPLTDGPYDCRWDGAFYVTDIGARWASSAPTSPTSASFLIRTDDGNGDPGSLAGESFLSDVSPPSSFPDGDYVFNDRYGSIETNREALGAATGYEVWACHQTIGALTQGLVTTADYSAGTTFTPCRTSVNSGPFADCADSLPLLEAIGISARFAAIAGTGDGSSVVPPAASGSGAVFRAFLHSDAAILRVEIEHDVTNPTAVHLHSAAAGENGPVLFDFPDPSSPIAVDGIQLATEDLTNLAAGNLYIEIHSQTLPDGEVRGQLVPADFTSVFDDGFESGDTSGWSAVTGN